MTDRMMNRDEFWKEYRKRRQAYKLKQEKEVQAYHGESTYRNGKGGKTRHKLRQH